MDREEWIKLMRNAMQNNSSSKVKGLCAKVDDVRGVEPCRLFCPFVRTCNWIEGLMHHLPDGTKV